MKDYKELFQCDFEPNTRVTDGERVGVYLFTCGDNGQALVRFDGNWYSDKIDLDKIKQYVPEPKEKVSVSIPPADDVDDSGHRRERNLVEYGTASRTKAQWMRDAQM